MTTTNITTYKTGTKQEILNSDASTPGVIAMATDTSDMLVSNGTGWSVTVANKRIGLQHETSNGEYISETPTLHFDANNRNTLLNHRGDVCVDGDEVAIWNSIDSSERLIQQPIARPCYVASDSNNNATVDLSVGDGMYLDTSISPRRVGSMTVMLVYTPTRQHHERVYTGPGDSSTTTNQVGGRYSYSEYQANNTTTFHEKLFTTDYARNFGASQDSLYCSLQQYSSDNTMQMWHPGGVTSYWAAIDGRYDLTNLIDDDSVNDLDHYNNNYRGKPQILSMRVDTSTGVTSMKLTLHTHNQKYLNKGQNIYSGSISTSNPILHNLCIGGEQLFDTINTYLSPNAYHEMFIFSSYLSDKDTDTLGTNMHQKWGSRIWDTSL